MPSKLLIKDLSFTSISTIIGAIVQFSIQIFVIRMVTQEAYGIFVLTFAVYSIIELLFTGYSSEYAQLKISEPIINNDLEKSNAIFHFLFRLDVKIFLPIACLLFIFGCIELPFSNFNSTYFLAFGCGLLFQIGYSVTKAILIATNKVQLQAKYEIFCSISYLLIYASLIYFYGIWGFVIGIPLCNLTKNLAAYWVIKKYTVFRFSTAFYKKTTLSITKEEHQTFTFYSFIRNGLLHFTSQLDLLLVGIFNGANSIAIYKIAKSLTSIAQYAVYPIWAGLKGRIVEALHLSDHARLRKLIFVPSAILLLGVAFAFPFFYYFGEPMIQLVYGTAYLDSLIPFLILLMGSMFFFVTNGWFNFWIIIANQQKLGIITSVSLILLLFLFTLLFGQFSIIHMAGAVALTLASVAILQIYLFLTTTAPVKFKFNYFRTNP